MGLWPWSWLLGTGGALRRGPVTVTLNVYGENLATCTAVRVRSSRGRRCAAKIVSKLEASPLMRSPYWRSSPPTH